jgi:hypothetical protein
MRRKTMSPDDKVAAGLATKPFDKDEVLQVLGEILRQVKPFHPPPLSQAALDAIASYHDNRSTLFHDGRLTSALR